MRISRLLILLVLPLLISCNQSGNDKGNLRPSAGTNQAALANLNLGIEYMRLGEYEKSLEKLDRARAADPGFSGIYNAYGLLYQLLERNREAEKNFKKAPPTTWWISVMSRDRRTSNGLLRLQPQVVTTSY